jgi:prepilin-type N-terminal cleavage/methylation domain-containing protein
MELAMKSKTKRQRGFTLLETLVSIAIIMTVAGILVVKSFGSMESYKANSAMDVVVSQFRVARQLAISQRRTVFVWVDTTYTGAGAGSQHIKYQIQPAPKSGEVAGPLISVALPGQTQYLLPSGVPDTPMAFGTCSQNAVCIGNVSGGPPIMQFNSTGTFTDGTGLSPLNGTVFVSIPTQPLTTRAVTIMGGTGRVRPYTFTGASGGWIE